MSKSIAVARLTAVRADSTRLIVEVHSDASFHSFYTYYSQAGNRRSTKTQVRVANRNEGLYPWHRAYRIEPGLEVISEQLSGFSSVKVRIIRRRMYRELLHAAPDVLGMTKVKRTWVDVPTPRPVIGYPVYIPQRHTTIEKKWSILTGRS